MEEGVELFHSWVEVLEEGAEPFQSGAEEGAESF